MDLKAFRETEGALLMACGMLKKETRLFRPTHEVSLIGYLELVGATYPVSVVGS